uniref:Uncharacterized protein n=1 Tax=Anguilla anguilla TaxID=7936 RepID=A0A0E9TQW8_ANGAN
MYDMYLLLCAIQKVVQLGNQRSSTNINSCNVLFYEIKYKCRFIIFGCV